MSGLDEPTERLGGPRPWRRAQALAGAAQSRALLAAAIAPLVLFALWSYAANLNEYRGFLIDDAFISFRYATHLAQGHGLVWNIGEAPSEGFTNLLLVLALAVCSRLGLDLPAVSQALGIAGALAAAALIWPIAARRLGVRPALAALAVAAFLTWPALAAHSRAGLETNLFMALLVAQLGAACALLDDARPRAAAVFLALGLLLGLTRPEGFAVTLLWLGAIAIVRRRGGPPRAVITAGAIFLLLIGLWLAARLLYFGHLLPNPLLVKAKLDSPLLPSLRSVLYYGLALAPLSLLVLLRLGTQRLDRYDLLLLAPLGFFALFYAQVEHVMGFEHRFMFPTYPLVVLLAARALEGLASSQGEGAGLLAAPTRARAVPGAAAALLLALALLQPENIIARSAESVQLGKFARVFTGGTTPLQAQGPTWTQVNIAIGEALREVGAGERLVCLTEDAGAIAYYSGCSLVDAVGLTDSTVARVGTREAYLDYLFGRHPDVIIYRQRSGFDLARFQADPEGERQEPTRWHGAQGRFGKEPLYLDPRFGRFAEVAAIAQAGNSTTYRWHFYVDRESPYFAQLTASLHALDERMP